MTRSVVLIFLCGLLTSLAAHAQPRLEFDRDALDYDRYELTKPDLIHKLKTSSNKLGLGGIDGWGVTGWFEYDFAVAQSGWYELVATLAGNYKNIEYIIDPQAYENSTGGTYQYSDAQGLNGATDKVSNVWLEAGAHVLRLQQYYWTGFPPLVHLELKPSARDLTGTVRIAFPGKTTVFRKGECQPLEIYSGQLPNERRLTVFVRDSSTGREIDRYWVVLPVSPKLVKQESPIYCSKQGSYTLSFGDAVGRPIAKQDIGYIAYEVIDTKPSDKASDTIKKTLIEEIDCATTEPDYVGGGETRVVREAFGSYRESGNVAWKEYQQLPAALRILAPEPSWFAYKLDIGKPQKPYIVEVDYPDDRQRGFAIALREGAPVSYPVAGGVDSGGEFSLSNTMVTQTLIFWPRAEDPRVVFMNARPGGRAAAAKIRVYRVDAGFPALRVPAGGGRHFANWYEEGSNFTSLYGMTAARGESKTAIERWVELAKYMGVDVLYPTVSVYNFNFYPSNYNRTFSSPPYDDMLRRMLLVAEQYDMKLIPDIHPRTDELSWGNAGRGNPQENLLVSKDGATLNNLPPYYNPIYPANQEWYVGMIGELVDRYKDSSALLGVSLRVMQWQNPTLNNFQSLDWGYDDYTVGLFQKETGVTVPGDATDAGRFRKRYDWLMANAKEEWVEWRCEKIAQLYKRISNRVRQARPDLKVYSIIFDAYPSEYGTDWLRGAGLDTRGLSEIEGVVLINSLHAYGRLYDDLTTQGTRDNLLDPEVLGGMTMPGRSGNVLSYARYFEATDVVLPPEKIGFDPATKNTWTSAVVNPSGRHYLERFAVALAETDAAFLGDGGNGYTIGQPLLREFLQEYRALPSVPFSPRKDARDPVAVWDMTNAAGYYFYAVNRERFPVEMKLTISGAGSVTRISTGEQLPLADGVLSLRLAPYQLMAFKTGGEMRIASVATDIPVGELNRVRLQVEWLEGLGKDAPRNLAADQRQRLLLLTDEARRALNRGWVWRARTIIENHDLLKIYMSTGRYPPELRDAVVRVH